MYRTQAGNTAEAAGIVMANVLDDYGNPKDLASSKWKNARDHFDLTLVTTD